MSGNITGKVVMREGKKHYLLMTPAEYFNYVMYESFQSVMTADDGSPLEEIIKRLEKSDKTIEDYTWKLMGGS